MYVSGSFPTFCRFFFSLKAFWVICWLIWNKNYSPWNLTSQFITWEISHSGKKWSVWKNKTDLNTMYVVFHIKYWSSSFQLPTDSLQFNSVLTLTAHSKYKPHKWKALYHKNAPTSYTNCTSQVVTILTNWRYLYIYPSCLELANLPKRLTTQKKCVSCYY